MESQRAGRMVMQLEGYRAFVPNPLPPSEPPLQKDNEMEALLEEAAHQISDLNGITRILPNPDFFVDMFVRKESLLSSQIEGTQASFADVVAEAPVTEDQREVSNYVQALTDGIRRIQEFPLCLRLIREIHGLLLATGRGSDKLPGEFRQSQNWIGPPGCTLETAAYVPPAPRDLTQALADLERFFHDEAPMAPLIKIALIHAQFETIHPFLDGNGRVGRLLITFWLVRHGILRRPVLYLSLYFKRHRAEYYDRLNAVRTEGAWEAWVRFFLKGVAEASREGVDAAERILALYQTLARQLDDDPICRQDRQILDHLFAQPLTTQTALWRRLGGRVSLPTVNKALRLLTQRGVLEHDGSRRNATYRFAPYLDILEEGTV